VFVGASGRQPAYLLLTHPAVDVAFRNARGKDALAIACHNAGAGRDELVAAVEAALARVRRARECRNHNHPLAGLPSRCVPAIRAVL